MCKVGTTSLAEAEPPQLLAPTVDSNKTECGGSPPWCWDKAARSRLGMTAPQAMQSAAAQLIVVCKVRTISLSEAEIPQLLAPTGDSNKTEQGGRRPWCWDEAARSGLGVGVPQAMQSAISADDCRYRFS
jgi:hypothetical protein